MNFERHGTKNTFAYKLGYVGMYLIFTLILYLILSKLNNLPMDWSLIHLVGVTLIIVLLGRTLKLVLK